MLESGKYGLFPLFKQKYSKKRNDLQDLRDNLQLTV